MKSVFAKRTTASLVTVALMFISFVAGNFTGFWVQPVLAQRSTPTEFAVFWEAWDLVVEYFVDREEVDFTAMTYGAIQGMLSTLGDENHTVFFSPDEAQQQASALEGSFEGIGAYVGQEEGQFIIVSPIRGSPADEAGIVAGDIVVAVDGTEITGMAEWEVISLIRGPAGSTVALSILHAEAEEPVEMTIKRGWIDIESVLWARIPGTSFAHLQITQFASDTSRELRAALQEINAERTADRPITGIILDLRNNPGGYLQEALRVANQFLPEGDVILHEQDAKGEITTYRVEGSGLAREIPLVVLVNQGSASAAEIVSGALQENGRAKLVGMPTVGTGTVLRPFSLSDGSVLRLGVTNWLTPNYALIKGQGVQPDLSIEQEGSVELMDSLLLEEISAADVRTHPDRQFQAALSWLTSPNLPPVHQAFQVPTPLE
ncbi:MAG: S41 family peptidase [Caldilineaceae bacterium]|nr:S41 family peptidase [Caldilineaceae bacterium]